MTKIKKAMPRREDFLAAALQRFARDGYASTSTRDICADVGLVHSAIYNYFDSKEAIVLAIAEREMLEMQAGLDAVIARDGDRIDVLLVSVVRFVMERALSRRQAWRLMNDMIRSLKPKNKTLVIERRDRFEGAVRQVLRQAIDSKLIPKQDVELASLYLFGVAEGMAGWYKQNGRFSFQEIIDYSMVFFLRAIDAADLVDTATGGLNRGENKVRKTASKSAAKPASKATPKTAYKATSRSSVRIASS